MWDDNDTWNDDDIWVENVLGERSKLDYVVITTNNNQQIKTYWLYEICKWTYNHYKTILEIEGE